MNKYRPERIALTSPVALADKFQSMLEKHLHPAAQLKRADENGIASFQFSPTKAEYFVVCMQFMAIGRSKGFKLANDTEK